MGKLIDLLAELKSNAIDVVLKHGELEVFYDGEDLDPISLKKIVDNKHELIQFLKGFEGDVKTYESIPSIPLMENYPLSSSQNRLWLVSQLEGGNSAYNLIGVYEIEGLLDVELIESTFKFIIERHESLRTAFKETEQGEVRQFIIENENIDFKIDYEDIRSTNGLDLNTIIKEQCEKPFDLEQGVLIRVKLSQIADSKYVLSLVMHHIISDGWSMEILIKELFTYYTSVTLGEKFEFQPLQIQYKDYAFWQQDQLKGSQLEKHKSYWTNQFTGEIPILDLPVQYQRPSVKTYNGKTLGKVLNTNNVKKLKDLSQSQGGTLFMAALSLVKVVLYRYTQQQDIIVGSSLAGREHADLEGQIGFFVNTLPLRTILENDDNFIRLLHKVKDVTLGAYQYYIYPLDELVENLSLKRDPSRNPLFDVMVDLQNAFGVGKEYDENQSIKTFDIKPYEVANTISRFDLHFNFSEKPEELHLDITYNTDIFSNEFVDQLLAHLEQLLTQIVIDPLVPLAELKYLNHDEEQQLLVEFNDTKSDYPSDKTIVDLFEEQVRKTPNNIAVIFENNKLTYQELNEKSNQLAYYLRENYAIKPDDLVGVKLTKSDKMIVALLGVLKSGAAYLPIDVNYPQDRITYIEQDCKCKVVLDEEEMMLCNLERYKYGNENPDPINKSGDLAYIIYTSGSTGQPKGVMVEHNSNVNMSLDQIKSFGITQNDKVVWFASVAFDASISEIMMSLYSGAALCIPSEETIKDKEEFVQFLKQTQSTVVTFPPSYLALLSNEDISGLRCIITAGESADPGTALRVTASEIAYYNAYGPTECAVCVSIYQSTGHEKRVIPIGKPISNTQIYILDDSLNPVPIGSSGKLFISGTGVARGYLNKPELTQEKFIANPFIEGERMYDTGDLGRWLSDGNIEFMGRKDHQVKIRGFRIELGEIEHAILQYGSDLKQVVVEAKESNEGKVLIAYFTASESIDKSALRSFLQGKLPDYMVPAFYVELEELPLTPNGKIDRKALPGVEGEDLIRNQYVAPRNETEEKLVVIWQQVLGIEKVGVTDSFFELGGHSLKITRLISEYYKVFDVKMSLKDLFISETLESHSDLIKASKKNEYVEIQKVEDNESYIISDSQRRFWVLSQFEEESAAFNMPAYIELNGNYDIESFKKAIYHVIDRHEILRTVFKVDDSGEIRQWILSKEQLDFKINYFDFRGKEENEQFVKSYIEQDSNKLFDLEKGPLLRASLIQLLEDKYVFYYNIHHIISDGWSNDVLVKDVFTCYEAFKKGENPELPHLRIQYKDYAAWQKKQLEEESFQLHRDYWLTKLSGELSILELPTFNKRPAEKTNKGRMLGLYLSKEISSKLKDYCQQNSGTLFMGLVASVKAMIYRYTGQEDIIIGSPIAGREHFDLENQIGCYLNTLVLRNEVKGNDSFNDLYANVKQTALDAYTHQKYPFDRLIEELDLKRDFSRSAIFDVLIVMQNNGDKNKGGTLTSDMTDNIIDYGAASSKFDLSLYFEEIDDCLSCIVEYNSDVYDNDLMEQFLKHYKIMLLKLLEQSHQPIAAIDYLSGEEKEKLLCTFNNIKYNPEKLTAI
jgi:amino acid adenylation domain-containing protein